MLQRLLYEKLSRRPFCLTGARGVGKNTLIKHFASRFSNWIHLDLETAADRRIFSIGGSGAETLKAISFLKDREIRGKGTLIVLDEIARCPEAIRWASGQADGRTSGQADRRTGGQADGPLVVAISSVMTKEVEMLTDPLTGVFRQFYLRPFSFEEFLQALDDKSALDAFREIPVPLYSHQKLLNYFHLYTLIGGMPEIVAEYAANRHITGLRVIYEKHETRMMESLQEVVTGRKSLDLARDVLQNTYPYAASRVSFNRFGNLEKGSREIARALKAIERTFFFQMVYPVTQTTLPIAPDTRRFPRIQMLDTGLVSYFSGIRKTLFQSDDMSAIFGGQVARQVVGQEILASIPETSGPHFWVREKPQSTASVDFVVPFDDMLIPVVVRPGEAGSLRSLHQFVEEAPHPFAVRLYAGKPGIQLSFTTRGTKFYLLSLPYFLAGKIKEYFRSFMRLADGKVVR